MLQARLLGVGIPVEGVAIDDDSTAKAEHIRSRAKHVRLDVLLELLQVEWQHTRRLCIAIGNGQCYFRTWPDGVLAIRDVGLVNQVQRKAGVDEPS